MKTKKPTAREKGRKGTRPQEKAYGEETTICINSGCVLRKKARCFGFEGCPGFKGR